MWATLAAYHQLWYIGGYRSLVKGVPPIRDRVCVIMLSLTAARAARGVAAAAARSACRVQPTSIATPAWTAAYAPLSAMTLPKCANHTLPTLSYPIENGMEPLMDAKTFDLHYNKHHGGYISKLNDALKSTLSPPSRTPFVGYVVFLSCLSVYCIGISYVMLLLSERRIVMCRHAL